MSRILCVLFSCAVFGCSAGSDAPATNSDPGFRNVFALSSAGQLYRSKDTGLTWQLVAFPTVAPIKSLASQDNDLYAATDSGVFVTYDDGDHWSNNFAGFFGTTTCVLSNGHSIYEGTHDGLYRSSDGGHYWEALEPGIMIANLAPFRNRIFASILNDSGLLVSPEDNGPNWKYLKTASIFKSAPTELISSNDYFYVGWSGWGSYFRTSDYGNNWQQVGRLDLTAGPWRFYEALSGGSQRVTSIDDGLHLQQIAQAMETIGGIDFLDRDFAVHHTFYGDSLLRTIDRGVTWRLMSVPWKPDRAFLTILTK